MNRHTRLLGLSLAAALALAGCAGTRSDALYQDLGGQPGVEALVDGMLARAVADPRIGKRFEDTKMDRLREKLIEQICQVSGGPCQYTGDSMKDVHAGMNLTHTDFNALVEDLIETMKERKLPMPAQNRLLARLAPMRPEVVHQ